MKKKGFTGTNSIPVDFSELKIDDLRIALETVKGFVPGEEERKGGALKKEEYARVIFPLKRLAQVFDVDFTINKGRISDIKKAIKNIEASLLGGEEFQEAFFSLADEMARIANPKGRKLPKKSLSKSIPPPYGSNEGGQILKMGSGRG